MTRFCALAGFALAVSLASGNSADAVAAAKKAPAQKGHAHHLLKAEEDLVAAEASIASGNLSQAQKHVAAAVKQLEEAIAHHKHHISQPATGGGTVGNVANRARHAHHHATLKQAVAELVVAEKELKAGAGAQASKEIVKASKTIKNAVTSHHHLFGKT